VDLTGGGLLRAVIEGLTAAVVGGVAVAIAYKVREWSGARG